MVVHASYSYEHSLNGLEAFQVGPYGEKNGREWSYIAEGAISGVDENGNVEYSDNFGYHYEDVSKIMLDWPNEYFTSLSGTYYKGQLNYYFSSLCFTTNRKKYGPFGQPSGTPFEFPMKGRVIVGFYGSVMGEEHHWTYGTLGVYVKHSTDLFGSSSQVQLVKPKTEVIHTHIYIYTRLYDDDRAYIKPFSELFGSSSQGQTENARVKVGPFGGQGGKEWIKIEWPREYLMSISGTHHTFEEQHVIESLCFHTNKKKYEPFGRTEGSPFDLPLKDRVIVGFHGRANNYINVIGSIKKVPQVNLM
ncbi:hypothetical protein ACOSQ3_020338 [Xanthoceras sorbifolium]